MSFYKTGHRDYPSIEKYTALLEKHGVFSAEAQAYLDRFPDDINFIRQAEAIKSTFIKTNDGDNQNNVTKE